MQVAVLDERMLSFHSPEDFSRNPRKIKPSLYKASEFRDFIHHYSMRCLEGLLPNAYFQHWRLFVSAVKTLSGNVIHPAELANAGKLLKRFVDDIPTLHGMYSTVVMVILGLSSVAHYASFSIQLCRHQRPLSDTYEGRRRKLGSTLGILPLLVRKQKWMDHASLSR